MTIIWNPHGSLNVATDPTSLPEERIKDSNDITSNSLTRFKNLRLDRQGVTSLRDGSSKVNSTAFEGTTELVTNGTFATTINNWTDYSIGGGSIAWSAGTMLFSSVSGSAISEQLLTIAATTSVHTLTVDATVSGSATINVSVGTTSGSGDLLAVKTISTTGSYSFSFTAVGASAYLRWTHDTNASDVSIDNVSVKRSIQPVNLVVEQGGARYEFAGNNIFRNESSIASGLTDAQWSAIKYNAYNDTTQQVYALNGTDKKRIESSTAYEWGLAAPAAPTTAVGSLTGLTGSYNAKVTYCRKVGSTVVYETNPSSAGTSRSLTNQSLSVTWVASSDSQVTHVRIYRTTSNGSVYYHDQDVAIGTVTKDTNTADSALGSTVTEDNDVPPLGSVVLGPAYGGTCFILKDNLLYYSKPKQPEYWPSLYFIEVSTRQFPLQTGVFHNGQLYCLSKRDIFHIQGTGHGTFNPIPMRSVTGAQGIFGAVSVYGKGIFHTGSDGIYLFAGEDRKITEENFEPLFRGETVNGMPGVSDMTTAFLHSKGNKLYFGYTSSGYTYPTNILVFNMDTGRVGYYEYNDGSVVSIRCITTDDTNNRLLVGDTGGFVRVIESPAVSTDSSTAISWDIQSKEYTLPTRSHFPRWVKYDVDAASASSCTGGLYLDGVLHQSHTLTADRDISRRLVKTGNGGRVSLRLNGSGPVEIYSLESE